MKFRLLASCAVLAVVAWLYWHSEHHAQDGGPFDRNNAGQLAPKAVPSGSTDADEAFKHLKIN